MLSQSRQFGWGFAYCYVFGNAVDGEITGVDPVGKAQKSGTDELLDAQLLLRASQAMRGLLLLSERIEDAHGHRWRSGGVVSATVYARLNGGYTLPEQCGDRFDRRPDRGDAGQAAWLQSGSVPDGGRSRRGVRLPDAYRSPMQHAGHGTWRL